MSNQSRISLDTTPFRRYFGRVVHKMGGRTVIDAHGAYLYLKAETPLHPNNQSSLWVGSEIVLMLSDDQTCWVIREFLVTSRLNRFLMLSGSEFLEHYGKRPGRNESDLAKPNKQRLWTMTRAADLQALLKAYDELAKEMGYPAVFGH